MLQNDIKNSWREEILPCNINCSFCFLNYTGILKLNVLFRDLDQKHIGLIIREIHHQVKVLETGEVLAVEGDKLEHLYMIIEGSVVGEMMDFEGKILRVEKLSAPETIATAFLFGNTANLPVTVTATEKTRLLVIPRADLLELFKKDPVILRNFLDIISDRAQFMSKRIKLLSLTGLKARISQYLLDIMKNTGKASFRIPNTQKELSEILGATRPSVGRAIRELHNSGYISAKGKNIEVRDRIKLSSLLAGEN